MKSRKMRLAILVTLFALGNTLLAQEDKVIFSVKDQKVTVEEFERQLLKNSTDKKITEEEIDEYLDRYPKFKMKYQDALDAKLDTNLSYIQELKMYRDQMAKPYLFDKDATDQLINEAYNRSLEEVNASHILVFNRPGASPADTLAAYKKIKGFYDSIKSGKISFEEMARSSEDEYTAVNGGALGYFSVFSLVYPFESAAYNTKVGEISGIFKTEFGYHIVKVIGRRPARQDIRIKYIYIKTGLNGSDDSEIQFKKIQEIHQQIKTGKKTFEACAKEFSQEYQSAKNGGDLGFLKSTQFIGDPDKNKILDEAYKLGTPNAVSEPFKTSMGWHLVKFVELQEPMFAEQSKRYFKEKVTDDSRSQLSRDVLIEKIKREDNYRFISGALDGLIACLDSNNFKTKLELEKLPLTVPQPKNLSSDRGVSKPRNNVFKETVTNIDYSTPILNQVLYTIGNEKITIKSFAEFLTKVNKPSTDNIGNYVQSVYADWIKDELVNYQDRHLEEKNIEFKYLYQEFKEGILMLNRTQSLVWDKANDDSVGLANFYQIHKDSFRWKDRFDIQVYVCNSDTSAKAVFKKVKKNLKPEVILQAHNSQNPLNVIFKSGKYELADSEEMANNVWVLQELFKNKAKYSKKANKVYKLGPNDGKYYIVKVLQYLPPATKSLDEARGPMVSKYQDYLQTTWEESLKSRYPLTINQEVVKEVKNRLLK